MGHPCKFQRVSRIGSITARHSNRPSRRQPNCGVEQRARLIFGKAAITLGSGPHSSLWLAALVIGQAIYIFHAVVSSSSSPRLISVVGDWMSTILPHMVWP